jgi:hypothetical protein
MSAVMRLPRARFDIGETLRSVTGKIGFLLAYSGDFQHVFVRIGDKRRWDHASLWDKVA